MTIPLNDITVIINDKIIPYIADSLSWKDGFGDYTTRNAVVGGGQTEQIFTKDLTSMVAMFKLSIPSTVENEANKREWKSNNNNNVIELIGPSGSNFAKIFTQCSIQEDPETNAGTEGNIEIEFGSNPAQ